MLQRSVDVIAGHDSRVIDGDARTQRNAGRTDVRQHTGVEKKCMKFSRHAGGGLAHNLASIVERARFRTAPSQAANVVQRGWTPQKGPAHAGARRKCPG